MDEPTRKPKDRNLKAAIGVGVALGIAMVLAARLSPIALLIVVQLFLVIALMELDRAFTMRRSQPPTLLAIVAMPISFFAAWNLGPVGLLMGVLLSFLVGVLGVMTSSSQGRAAERFGLYALMVLWVPFLASFLALILRMDNGIWIVLSVFALAASNDIGAYIVGRRFGKHPLAKTISPGKTWEGMFGGLATTVLIAVILFFIVPLPDGIDVWQMGVMGIGMSLASVFGDLFESLIKRDLGVKDLGSILPGHGGVMDRIDAHLFAFPVAWLLLTVTGV
ncbi:phosphatidate cytidylyltransferase [Stomatohabitans albus]|uniref:phosphatidate cytidylyltransferase n=1 Tax=Stomatohabitans albus TaxID=3110766 RepID=UPI00300DB781